MRKGKGSRDRREGAHPDTMRERRKKVKETGEKNGGGGRREREREGGSLT